MAVPTILTDPKKYGPAWTGVLTVGQNVRNPGRGTGNVTKTFHAYVENYEQSAHDTTMAGYLRGLSVTPRSPHRAQVQPPNTNTAAPLTYYGTHGQMASQLAAAELQRRWTAAAQMGSNATVFNVGQAYPLAVQGQRQSNGFHYDVTLWYDVNDVYVAFHCYRP